MLDRINVQNNPINVIDPIGLYCEIISSDPASGGDPLDEWVTEEKIEYQDSVAEWMLMELLLSRSKLPLSNPGVYEYTIRFTTWQLLKLYVQYCLYFHK